jgi:hypothetical protein
VSRMAEKEEVAQLEQSQGMSGYYPLNLNR